MSRALLTLVLLAMGLAGATAQRVADAAAPAASYVRAGRFLDVESGAVLRDRLIRIVEGRVTAVTPWQGAPGDGPLTDWSRYLVLPGLIDLHTHLADYAQSSNPAEPLLHSAAAVALRGAQHARQTLRAGFTAVRDVGCFRAFTDVALRDAINAGEVEGPRMAVAGAYITVPGGGGEVTGFAPDVRVPEDMRVGVVRDADEVALKTRHLFQNGADFIKLIATGAVLAPGTEPGQQELGDAELRAAVEQARRHGRYVIAHAHGVEGIKAAIRAGVRSIEHASLIDAEGIRLAKEHGVYLDMDIYNGDYIETVGSAGHWPEDTLRKNRETTGAQREGFRRAVQAGVKLTFGTDAGVYPHGQNARQFDYMVRHGMTPLQAIQSATTVAAESLGWSRDVGALSPGHYADMIAVEGDALADIRVLEHVVAVIKGGVPVR
jgi:imidazolonepropionase-like amidohydrolase